MKTLLALALASTFAFASFGSAEAATMAKHKPHHHICKHAKHHKGSCKVKHHMGKNMHMMKKY